MTNKKSIDLINKSLEYIRKNSKISSEGKPSFSSGVYSDITKEIIISKFPFKEELPISVRRSIIFRWIKYKKEINNTDHYSSFRRAVNVEIKNIKKKEMEYFVLMFLNVREESLNGLKSIDILGNSLNFIKWNDVNKLDMVGLWKEVRSYKRYCPILMKLPYKYKPQPNTDIFTPISMRIAAHNPEIAVELASERLDTLRSIFNTSSIIGSYTYFRSTPKPLSKILPTPIYIIFNKGRHVETYYTIESFDYKAEKINIKRKKSIEFLLTKFAKSPIPDSMWHHILKILNQYQKALDTNLPEAAYLAMWQVLENSIRFRKENIKNQEIRSRISILLGLDPLVQEILTILADKRNDFVHFGESIKYDDQTFFILKMITDSVIYELINLAKKFTTLPEVKEYLSLSSLGKNDLQRKIDVIKIIKESRSI